MLKNIFATIGLAVVIKAAYEHYREYQELKREKAEREKVVDQQSPHSRLLDGC